VARPFAWWPAISLATTFRTRHRESLTGTTDPDFEARLGSDFAGVRVHTLKNFAPTYAVAAADLVPIPVAVRNDPKNTVGVAPELAEFLSDLAKIKGVPAFSAENRPKHGGGIWAGKGFSVDMYLRSPNESRDQRGFWMHSAAVLFLLSLDALAKTKNARWRVLYNDFRVAQEVNKATGTGRRVHWPARQDRQSQLARAGSPDPPSPPGPGNSSEEVTGSHARDTETDGNQAGKVTRVVRQTPAELIPRLFSDCWLGFRGAEKAGSGHQCGGALRLPARADQVRFTAGRWRCPVRGCYSQ
jgi:hypothetical protein